MDVVASNGRHRSRTRSLRFRLTAAFILVALATGAVLVGTTYLLIRQTRTSTFLDRAENEARLALLSAPAELGVERFEALILDLQERGDIDGIVIVDAGGRVHQSVLDVGDVPPELLDGSTEELASADIRAEGVPYHLVSGEVDGASYTFAFSRDDVLTSIRETRDTLLLGWLIAVVAAALLGRLISRRTLAPARELAEASQALADGMLETRVEPAANDEFASLASAFNGMADALATKIDQLSEAAARERRFTADLAHELRTPLMALTTSAALVEPRLDELPPALRQPVGYLVDSVERLHQLVVDLLELSRHDAGHEVVELEPLSISRAVDAVVVGTADPDRVTASVDGDPWVLADPRRFGRVVGNLVGNALRHTDGPVEVRAAEDGAEVRVDVLDRGPGLRGIDIPRLFDRFYKSDSSRSGGGSGLGLAIARENAQLQRGRLEAANRPEGGARFTFRLPRCDPPRPLG